MKTIKPQRGMTLIEIMIALLIGAFLLTGIIQIFIGSRQSYRMQESMSRLQENGRFALEFLAHDIRMAGFWGCRNPTSPDIDIAGTNNNATNGDNIDDGTDTLTLKGAFVQTPTGTCGDAVLSTDAFYTHATSTITYKINNGVLQQDTNGLNNPLVEGIENMQILYGADTNSDNSPDYYVAAGTTGLNMAQVVSIRISLLAATIEDNLTSQSTPYTYNGATTTPSDLKIRRVFSSTIAVRNRLP
ncbi:PilW family protein [Methylomonas fluvii]|nr:PilW family protein [Methylomonas fluvii]CAD6874078.1 Type IV fimbrial biogenesis protein PilW [Methylomonas fluvii]